MLTDAAVPANLGLKLNTSAAAQRLAAAFNSTYPACTGAYAVFTLHGQAPTPVLSGKTIYPQLFSQSATCPDAAKAQAIYTGVLARVKTFGAITLSGFGNAAILVTSTTPKAHSYVIFWRDGPVLASVQLAGPTSNTRINVDETELLAHRQISLH